MQFWVVRHSDTWISPHARKLEAYPPLTSFFTLFYDHPYLFLISAHKGRNHFPIVYNLSRTYMSGLLAEFFRIHIKADTNFETRMKNTSLPLINISWSTDYHTLPTAPKRSPRHVRVDSPPLYCPRTLCIWENTCRITNKSEQVQIQNTHTFDSADDGLQCGEGGVRFYQRLRNPLVTCIWPSVMLHCVDMHIPTQYSSKVCWKEYNATVLNTWSFIGV